MWFEVKLLACMQSASSFPPFFCLDTKETKDQGRLKTRLGVVLAFRGRTGLTLKFCSYGFRASVTVHCA